MSGLPNLCRLVLAVLRDRMVRISTSGNDSSKDATNGKPSVFRKLLPMLDVSENLANSWFSIANIMLMIGALLALAGTIGTVWLSGVREKYADAKNLANIAATAKANAEAAKANERAAHLEKEAADARLEQQKLAKELQAARDRAEEAHKIARQAEIKQRPRGFSSEQRAAFIDFMKDKPKGKVRVIAQSQSGDAPLFSQSLCSLLRDCGFDVTEVLGAIALGAGRGLYLAVADANAPPSCAGPLQQAFQHIGINAIGREGAAVGYVDLLVGEKSSE